MKILFVEHKQVFGGGQVFLRDLARGMADAGHDCVVVHERNDRLGEELRKVGVESIMENLGPIRRPGSLSDAAALLAGRLVHSGAVLRLLRRTRPDIVCANDLFSLVVAGPSARFLGVPVVMVAHNATYTRGLLSRLALRLASRIVCLCEAQREHLRTDHAIAGSVLRTIPNGIPVPPAGRRRRRSAAPVVAFIGRLSEEKGADLFLEAIAPLLNRKKNLRAVVVGDGPDMDVLRARARSLAIDRKIAWKGYQPDIRSFLRTSMLLVISSRTEAMPYVLLEAMREGCPVVASAVGGIPEVLADEVNGRTVPPDDPAALRKAIEDVLASGRDRARYAARARSDLESAYNIGTMLRRYDVLFRTGEVA